MNITKLSFIFIFLLTFFSLALRAYRLDEPNHYYFDEVYHAVTAKAYADNNPAAYDPYAHAPKEGTAYDWLHPPLAKLIQAGSIKVLGDNAVAWRLPSLFFGTAIIPAVFILTFIIFGPIAAMFASTAIAFENLTFVMSRITMNDVFITFFAVCAFIFCALYLKSTKLKYLIFCAIFLGLSVSSKWTGLYAIAVCTSFILWKQVRTFKIPRIDLALMVLIPVLIYLSSYGQFWLQRHTIRQFIDLHKQIWWYQNTRDLKHSYATTPLYCVPDGLDGSRKWCPWILDIRGVYFSYEQYGENAGYIYAIGNPAVFILGIIAISYLLGKYLDEKKGHYLLILSGYFVFWIPWIFSPRIMFLYHYLPALPFLAISIGVAFADIFGTKFKLVSILLTLLIIAVFLFLYPISSGMPIKIADIDKFMLIPTWR